MFSKTAIELACGLKKGEWMKIQILPGGAVRIKGGSLSSLLAPREQACPLTE